MKSAVLGGAALAAALAAGLGAFAPAAKAQTSCDRGCLEGFVDRYFKAVMDDDPSEVPLSINVRFTENGQQLPIGEGLWKSMKAAGKYRLFVTDVPAGQVALITTVVEDGRDPSMGIAAAMALRLKIVNGEIAEIEQMVERNEMTAQRIEAMGQPRAAFTTAIPDSARMSRHDIITTANKYFSGMQQNDGKGDYPFAEDCDRYENGGHTTNAAPRPGETRPDPATANNYSATWTCLEQFKSGLLHFVTRIRDRRYVAVDQERGVVMAIAFFDHMAGSTRTFKKPNGETVTAGPTQPWTWYIAEVFKIHDHKIGPIEAFLIHSPYGMNSGWSSYTDGLSDRAQDVTGYHED
ncbi:MAG TPA: hypothetical protein VFV10_08040 [Gammaproteobacteria bacterium]|nr:hypothetical protein [Gammaproteobacteria bacterium]